MSRAWPLVLAAVGCAHLEGPPPAPLTLPGSQLTIAVESAADGADLAPLITLAAEALPALDRWGGLRVRTRVVVVRDHAALEARVHRPGFDWLRAWARYDVVYLQAPRTWNSFGQRPTHDELRDLLTHELSHCAMYQAVSDGSDWFAKQIPLWFREGLASWTARQANKRLGRAALASALQRHPSIDPLRDADQLVRTDEPLIYGAAHWAFADLVADEGEDRVRAVLGAMREGSPFPRAFGIVYAMPASDFANLEVAALRQGVSRGTRNDRAPRKSGQASGSDSVTESAPAL